MPVRGEQLRDFYTGSSGNGNVRNCISSSCGNGNNLLGVDDNGNIVVPEMNMSTVFAIFEIISVCLYADRFSTFKRNLKTELFDIVYSDCIRHSAIVSVIMRL